MLDRGGSAHLPRGLGDAVPEVQPRLVVIEFARRQVERLAAGEVLVAVRPRREAAACTGFVAGFSGRRIVGSVTETPPDTSRDTSNGAVLISRIARRSWSARRSAPRSGIEAQDAGRRIAVPVATIAGLGGIVHCPRWFSRTLVSRFGEFSRADRTVVKRDAAFPAMTEAQSVPPAGSCSGSVFPAAVGRQQCFRLRVVTQPRLVGRRCSKPIPRPGIGP